jgi:hypothetical protein
MRRPQEWTYPYESGVDGQTGACRFNTTTTKPTVTIMGCRRSPTRTLPSCALPIRTRAGLLRAASCMSSLRRYEKLTPNSYVEVNAHPRACSHARASTRTRR